jgi:hypothetical protein
MTTTAALSRQEMEALIVERAWKDEAFRAEFLADAKGTIEKHAGQKLPPEVNVVAVAVAVAEDDRTIHFVIPLKPANADELPDAELEKVAGGIDFITGMIGFSAIAVVGISATAAVGSTKATHGW